VTTEPARNPRTPSETTLRRLAFVKYMFWLALEQSQRPEPLSSVAVLQCHDAVEFFLDMAVEAHDVSVPSSTTFMGYWELIGPKVRDGLAHKEAMRRLDKARAGLKHHGTLVTALDVRDLCESTRRFFVENTLRCFGVDFDRISLANLVWHEQVRSELQLAVNARAADNLDSAFAHAAVALERLLDDYTQSAKGFGSGSPFEFATGLGFLNSHMLGLRPKPGDNTQANHVEAKLKEYVDKMNKIVEAIQTGMKFLTLGLDYRRHTPFVRLTPHVYRTLGNADYNVTEWAPPRMTEMTRTPEDADFCIEFVVETALRLQDVDLSLPRKVVSQTP